MREAEAKTKWCPSVRVQDEGDGRVAINRHPYGPKADQCCIASACMAWQVRTRLETRHRDGHVVQPGEVYLRGNATTHEVPDGGYCGLAGAPQS